MKPTLSLWCVLLSGTALMVLRAGDSPTLPAPSVSAVTVPEANALKWDAEAKDLVPKAGELSVSCNFTVTNVSAHEVTLNSLRTSCGCTVAQLPTTPYTLKPGANVPIAVTLHLRGKSGTLTKTVTVTSSAGVKTLIVRANLPPATTSVVPVVAPDAPVPSAVLLNAPAAVPAAGVREDRALNIQNALVDRQAIFKGDCAKCHVDRSVGKMGAELYAASCVICHEADHRATMVPDLKVPRSPRDLAFWQKWIAEGRPGTLMPAFAAAHGGPLTQEQADSLTVYLYQTFPRTPPAALSPPLVTTVARQQ